MQGKRRASLGFYVPLIRFLFSVICFLSTFADFVSVVRFLVSLFTLLILFSVPCLFTAFFSVFRFALSDSYFRFSVCTQL